MKLDELAGMIAAGDTTAKLMEAMGQRMVRVPQGWDWENVAGVCECGLLLAELPRTIRQTRVVVMGGQALHVFYDMTHVHVAADDGTARCAECWEEDAPCAGHAAEMCDTPNAEMCANCVDRAAMPNRDHCLECRPYEAEWDKDRYLGL